MDLFDDVPRTDIGPSTYAEDSFTYYNRSARVGVANIRSQLQRWFDRYPAASQAELATRFRADFQAAFFELFLHELALRLDVQVHVHPELGSGRRARPDFEFTDHAGSAYAEACVVRDESAEDRRRRRMKESIYDSVNRMPITDYFLRIADLEIRRGRQPSIQRFRVGLTEWLSSLEYFDLVGSDVNRLDEFPTWVYEDDDLFVRISAMPVSARRRGSPAHRPVGILPAETRWGGSDASLLKALQRKRGKYGDLDAPFVIAVNSLSRWGCDRDDQLEALFGREQYIVYPDDREPQAAREPNGFWYGPNGPQNRRVSAVLFAEVMPWNVHVAALRLYHNPAATHPYLGSLTRLPQAVLHDVTMTWLDGSGTGQILGLDPNWLGE